MPFVDSKLLFYVITYSALLYEAKAAGYIVVIGF